MSIAEKLKKLRGDRTQREIAEAVGVRTATITMYETGKRIPSDRIKKRLAKYFKVDIGELFFAD